MSFATRNLGISMNQGDSFALVIGITDDSGPIDITGYEFLGEMKLNTSEDTEVAAEFDFTLLPQTGATLGQVKWSLSSADTTGLPASISDAERKNRLLTPYVFDVKMKDTAGNISRIIQGIIYVSPEVTQEGFT